MLDKTPATILSSSFQFLYFKATAPTWFHCNAVPTVEMMYLAVTAEALRRPKSSPPRLNEGNSAGSRTDCKPHANSWLFGVKKR
jgi:hypothetical protein